MSVSIAFWCKVFGFFEPAWDCRSNMRAPWYLFAVLLFILLCNVRSAPKGSLKRRLERAERHTDIDHEPSSSGLASSSTDPAPAVPRGPLSRRLARAEGPTTTRDQDLPLTRVLLKRWANGDMSAKAIHEIAFAAHQQGTPGIARLASAGAHGAHPQNLQRAIFNYFGKPAGAPPFEWITVPSKQGRIMHPVFMPHSFLFINICRS